MTNTISWLNKGYTILKFDDNLVIDIGGILVPAVSTYPDLWELYLKRLQVRALHTLEVTKATKGEKNDADILEVQLNVIKHAITDKMQELNIPPYIYVTKIDEKDNAVIVKAAITGKIYYVDKKIYENGIVTETTKDTNRGGIK